MDPHGYRTVVPVRDPTVAETPFLDFTPAMYCAPLTLPKQGSRAPWRLRMNYFYDLVQLRYGKVADPALRFSSKRHGGLPEPQSPGPPGRRSAAGTGVSPPAGGWRWRSPRGPVHRIAIPGRATACQSRPFRVRDRIRTLLQVRFDGPAAAFGVVVIRAHDVVDLALRGGHGAAGNRHVRSRARTRAASSALGRYMRAPGGGVASPPCPSGYRPSASSGQVASSSVNSS